MSTIQIPIWFGKGSNRKVVAWSTIDAQFAWIVALRKTWGLTVGKRNGGPPRSRYVTGIIEGRPKLLHKLIYEHHHGPVRPGLEIDHKDRNTLNNALENLRAVSPSVNRANSKLQSNNTSGYRGVRYYKAYGNWMACVKKDRKERFLGYFSTPEDAAKRVNEAFAVLFPEVSPPNPTVL